MLIFYFSFQAFLTGCSAGGLATYIHCDSFRALLPKDSRAKCLADGGFFLDMYVSLLHPVTDIIHFAIYFFITCVVWFILSHACLVKLLYSWC
jgi:hypothetical protein